MKFPFTKPEELPDETLDEIAAEDEQRRLALLEREKRIEERRVAAEAEARRKGEAEKRAKVDALAKEHAALADEVAKAHDALGASIVAAADLLEKRDAALREVWRVRAALKDLGVAPPPFDLAFTVEAKTAGRRLAPFVDREMTESPIASAARNSPSAFFR